MFQKKYLLLAIIWILFFVKGLISLDPDFGWHIRMGQLILASGIPLTDPFSYTMPSFHYVDHEWLANIVLYKLSLITGTIGLSAFFATLTMMALLISLPKNLVRFSFAPLLLSSAIVLPFSGIRLQVITWLLLSILITLLFKAWNKVRFFVPLFFMLWANVHGGFALGLGILVLFIGVRFWERKRVDFLDILVVILCIAGTLVNPYGIRLWGEIWMSISDNSLRFTIIEWMPVIFRFDFVYLLLATISSFLLYRYKSKLSVIEKVLFSVLLIMGLISQRHVPLWVIVALPLLIKAIYFLSEDAKELKMGKERFAVIYKGFLVLSILSFIVQGGLLLFMLRAYAEDRYYPREAISFIRAQKLNGELFAPYDWGGYLIWHLPEKRVFVDGRMPSWRYSAPKGESNYAYKNYSDLLSGKMKAEDVLNQYDIREVLWPKLTSSKSNSFIEKIRLLGWKKVYEDQIAVVYQKP